ncbi:unnamed protein product [Meloidogyne enterolobii]|uniref:Uncharacterized protein n=1 Tax=Meloidogyne enterolobii TaxID=390850 RepID=A0ACB0XT47_MELEN
MQMIPWQIRVFLHTLTFVCSNKSKESMDFFGEYTLARDGMRPLLIELNILLPANSKCKIEFEFEAAFLKISEFPPDANSGIHVPGAVLSISQDDSTNLSLFSTFTNKSANQKIFGEPLLILLPVPDFSMPFNVICFVCSTIAIFYGNIFALSTKLMKLFPKEEKLLENEQESMLTVKQKIFKRFYNLFSR